MKVGNCTLRKTQVEDLEFLRENRAAALFHDLGYGKSYPTAIRIIELMDQHPGCLSVIIAEKSLLRQWAKLFEEMECPHNVEIISGDIKPATRVQVLARSQILVVNYDFIPKIEKFLNEEAMTCRLLAIVCDEVHRLKGFRGFRSKYGKRAKILMKVAEHTPHRIALTGSPITNPDKPDVWGIYHLLDPQIFGRNRIRFEETFFYDLAPKGQHWKKLRLKPHMKQEMSRRIYSLARRYTKADMKELGMDLFPSEAIIRYDCPMPPGLAHKYRELEKHSITELESGEEVARPAILAKLITLQQLASGAIINNRQVGDIGFQYTERTIEHLDSSHKDKVLASILDEIGPDASVIIWAVFTHEIEHLMTKVSELRGEMPARADGKVKGTARESGIQDFKDGKVKTLVAHPAAAGAGLNLQVAGHDIRWSRTPKLLEIWQSRGRNVRTDKTFHDHVTHHELVSIGTRDAWLYEQLEAGRDVASSITLDDLSYGVRT